MSKLSGGSGDHFSILLKKNSYWVSKEQRRKQHPVHQGSLTSEEDVEEHLERRGYLNRYARRAKNKIDKRNAKRIGTTKGNVMSVMKVELDLGNPDLNLSRELQEQLRVRAHAHLTNISRFFNEVVWEYSKTNGEEDLAADAEKLIASVVAKSNNGIDFTLLMDAVGKLNNDTHTGVHVDVNAGTVAGAAVGDLDLLKKVDSSL